MLFVVPLELMPYEHKHSHLPHFEQHTSLHNRQSLHSHPLNAAHFPVEPDRNGHICR
jgi:hypothetical protein